MCSPCDAHAREYGQKDTVVDSVKCKYGCDGMKSLLEFSVVTQTSKFGMQPYSGLNDENIQTELSEPECRVSHEVSALAR